MQGAALQVLKSVANWALSVESATRRNALGYPTSYQLLPGHTATSILAPDDPIQARAGFSAYTYALRHLPATFVSLYAYVNPVVAVLAGSIILSEPISPQLIVGGAIVVAGVAIMVTARSRAAARGAASH